MVHGTALGAQTMRCAMEQLMGKGVLEKNRGFPPHRLQKQAFGASMRSSIGPRFSSAMQAAKEEVNTVMATVPVLMGIVEGCAQFALTDISG